ncbi:MAG TPA: hypothetical protein VHV08_10175, partial [Pirellulales bacterium]|nr:hypothetical protein [Pirellulales bacterium]
MTLVRPMSSCRCERVGAAVLLVAIAATIAGPIQAGERGTIAPTVHLTIDYGDGASKVFALPWKQDMTVLDAMNLAKANRHGIKFVTSGSGDTAFVSG